MKISCCIQSKNSAEWLGLALASALEWADEIIISDENSTDGTKSLVSKMNDGRIVLLQEDFGGHFGKQRQAAYDKTTGDWVFWLDADECLIDNARQLLERTALECDEQGVYCVDVQYIHFVHDLRHVDNSEPVHFGIQRFHKRLDNVDFSYRANHTLPKHERMQYRAQAPHIVIFHYGYATDALQNLIRYKRNVCFSEIHSEIYQAFWRDWHYHGYPAKEFDWNKMPIVAKSFFEVGEYSDRIKNRDHALYYAGVIVPPVLDNKTERRKSEKMGAKKL